MSERERQSLPSCPGQITPPFLTSVLRDGGAVRKATVAAISVEPLAAKASYNAQLARLRVTYDVQEASAPRSLIAKLPTVNVALQENAAVFRPGAKECWFYRHGAHRTPVNVPHCYFCEVYPATGESFLLLEDLAPARTGSWVDGASLKEADLALQTAARLHAAWWATDTTAERELAHLMDNLGEEQDLVERLY